MAYLLIKAFHIIAVISWMAGLLYLPRLFIYHVDAEKGSKQSETFKIMEGRLLQVIMTPAMIVSWALGLIMIFGFQSVSMASDTWLQIKLVLVLLMTIYHFFLARWRQNFAQDRNKHPARFYRIANEVPTVLMIFIVILVVVRPF